MIHRHTAVGLMVIAVVTVQFIVFFTTPSGSITGFAVNTVAIGTIAFYWGMRFENRIIRPSLDEARRIANAYRVKNGLEKIK